MGHLTQISMRQTYIINDNIITSLGFTTRENIESIRANVIGIRTTDDPLLYPRPVPLSLIDSETLEKRFNALCEQRKRPVAPDSFTRLEKLLITSMQEVVQEGGFNPYHPKTLLILSTTKGNIDLLEERYKARFNHKRLFLWELARVVQNFFGFINTPVIISNACISGVLALIISSRYIQSGLYDDVVVAGGDIVSEFVIAGFQSFQALSPDPCKPFDQNRTGLSLGEAAGTIHLSAKEPVGPSPKIILAGGATTNDANHISGPSRTGQELSLAMDRALQQAAIEASSLDYIAAHGTATAYNDEMEAKAIGLSKAEQVPVASQKGYWGHTLGAAGIIESVVAVASMRNNQLYRSAGFETQGVTVPLNILTEHRDAEVDHVLKSASGFGGCNAAVVFNKI